MNVKLTKETSLVALVVCVTTIAIIIVGYNYFEAKRIEKIDRVTNKFLREIEEKYGPGKCTVCGWPQSISAKTCTHCGAPR